MALCDLKDSNHKAVVECVAFTPDGTRIVVVSSSKKVLVIGEYDRKNGTSKEFTNKEDMAVPSFFAVTDDMVIGAAKMGFLDFFSFEQAGRAARVGHGTEFGQNITGVAVSRTKDDDVVLSCADQEGFITCHGMDGNPALFGKQSLVVSVQ